MYNLFGEKITEIIQHFYSLSKDKKSEVYERIIYEIQSVLSEFTASAKSIFNYTNQPGIENLTLFIEKQVISIFVSISEIFDNDKMKELGAKKSVFKVEEFFNSFKELFNEIVRTSSYWEIIADFKEEFAEYMKIISDNIEFLEAAFNTVNETSTSAVSVRPIYTLHWTIKNINKIMNYLKNGQNNCESSFNKLEEIVQRLEDKSIINENNAGLVTTIRHAVYYELTIIANSIRKEISSSIKENVFSPDTLQSLVERQFMAAIIEISSKKTQEYKEFAADVESILAQFEEISSGIKSSIEYFQENVDEREMYIYFSILLSQLLYSFEKGMKRYININHPTLIDAALSKIREIDGETAAEIYNNIINLRRCISGDNNAEEYVNVITNQFMNELFELANKTDKESDAKKLMNELLRKTISCDQRLKESTDQATTIDNIFESIYTCVKEKIGDSQNIFLIARTIVFHKRMLKDKKAKNNEEKRNPMISTIWHYAGNKKFEKKDFGYLPISVDQMKNLIPLERVDNIEEDGEEYSAFIDNVEFDYKK